MNLASFPLMSEERNAPPASQKGEGCKRGAKPHPFREGRPARDKGVRIGLLSQPRKRRDPDGLSLTHSGANRSMPRRRRVARRSGRHQFTRSR